MNFKELIVVLLKINEELQTQTLRAVNTSLTLRNWFFGFYIVEFEQKGKDRADYGKSLLINIAAAIKDLEIPNTNERELRRYRQLYIVYPVVANLIADNIAIPGLLTPELVDIEYKNFNRSIRGSLNPELDISDHHCSHN